MPESEQPTVYHYTKYYYLGGGMEAELERIRELYVQGKMTIEEFMARYEALIEAEKRIQNEQV